MAVHVNTHPSPGIRWYDAFMAFLDDFFAGRPTNTARAYRSDLETFRAFAGAGSTGEAIDALMKSGYSHTQSEFARYQELSSPRNDFRFRQV
jgi:hypothetical protein